MDEENLMRFKLRGFATFNWIIGTNEALKFVMNALHAQADFVFEFNNDPGFENLSPFKS